MSQLKIKNGSNWESIPAGGIGVPSGGTTGQVLQKSSNTDYATEWATDENAYTAVQTLTATKSSQTITGVFNRRGKAVFVTISSTGSVNFGNDWQTLFTGLNDDFIPVTSNVIACVAQAPSHAQGIKLSVGSSTVQINMANTSAWVEGCFTYFL